MNTLELGLRRTNLKKANLKGADFSNANLKGAKVDRVDWIEKLKEWNS
ncbi:MAG: pentapeptide repeat-containing protein [Pseudomonadales bacterium]|nr:pentapeptide repeat-containing protein [Lewinellaceae bacterium]MCP5303675.1 pentapeptide repeat-containing protein [Pseudomonadales bacterium]